MTPDPAMLYLTAQHQEALAGLMYAVLDAKGLVVLTGEAGTGKTTLLARTLQQLPAARVRASLVVNPSLTAREFLEMALIGWGIADPPESKARQLLLLQKMLLQARADGQIMLLVVDEAHALSAELLEEIRLLGNFEQPDCKLLQILLAGQNELNVLLNHDNLRQFKQRVAVRLKVEPMHGQTVREYIHFRWTEAGGTEPPFAAAAYSGIALSSGGIPRVINALCDNALTLALAEGAALVTDVHIREACRDLDLPDQQPASVKVLPVQVNDRSPEAALPAASFSMNTLERYSSGKPAKSFWSRCAGIWGAAH